MPERLFSLFKEKSLIIEEEGKYIVDPNWLKSLRDEIKETGAIVKSIEFDMLGDPEQVFADFFCK